MDLAKLNDWMQVIGIFAVVASLLFVGLQMKQDREIALAGQYQARTNAFLELNLTAMEINWTIPPLRSHITDDVTAIDIAGALWMWTSFDNHNFQFESGFLKDEAWQAHVRNQQELYSVCQMRFVYEWRRKGYPASVVALVDSWDDPCTEDN